MFEAPIFISHASADDAFVKALREKLELFKVGAWVDSREIRGGDPLEDKIISAIQAAPHFIVILSRDTINSQWVPKEIKWAEEVKQKKEGYSLIPILLPGVSEAVLDLFFQKRPLAIKISDEHKDLNEAFQKILAATGQELPLEGNPFIEVSQDPIAELQLKLTKPGLETRDGKHRAMAEAVIVYRPADPFQREEESSPFYFEAPLGPIEKEDLSWYLERYITWPVEYYQEQARGIEANFPQWGKLLYEEATKLADAKRIFQSWQEGSYRFERRFSVFVNSALVEGSKEEDIQKAKEGANLLLSLPWELLHDEKAYLFKGKNPVGIRRRLPNRERQAPIRLELPLRILLVSPRPEEEGVGYIDHRASSIPLVEAVENLGELIKLDILHTPTLPALQAFLQQAERENDPVEVLHFDGHGVYDPINGLGALCFEDSQDQDKIGKRRNQQVDAQVLGKMLRDYRIPLVFLEAYQTAMTEKDPTSSVAAQLLNIGVSSVIAMSHTVLVETASRFVRAFYQSLATGSRVGQALLAGQTTLYEDTYRGKLLGGKDFHLQDWFVPVLFQEEQDPQLFDRVPSVQAKEIRRKAHKLNLGALPETPSHSFIGRSRELLSLERILQQESYVVIRGQVGVGKTTIAIELARWWVRSYRAQRAAFISMEGYKEQRQILDELGQQLVANYSVAEYGEDLEQAILPIERALKDFSTLIVLDNLESILPDSQGNTLVGSEDAWDQVKVLCTQLHESSPQTKLIFTSREPLPAPFDKGRNDLFLGPLGPKDAVDLLHNVMSQAGWEPPPADEGSEEELKALAKTINYHARALVLLAREIATQGVQSTHVDIAQLMVGLEQKYPGDRENSLFASLELSLRRLSLEERALLPVLAPSQGGNNWQVWANMLGGLEENKEQVISLVKHLEAVGLGSILNYNYIQLDPALAIYLQQELPEETFSTLQEKWLDAMIPYTRFLYTQRATDARLAAYLSAKELPNLLVMLELAQGKLVPEELMDTINSAEGLLRNQFFPKAKLRVENIRKGVSQNISKWSSARYLSLAGQIESLEQQGRLQDAFELAQNTLKLALEEGEGAYQGADYDTAMCFFRVGSIMDFGGASQAAIEPLVEAQRRFGKLAEEGSSDAERALSLTFTRLGNCFTDLGQYDRAEGYYNRAILLHETEGRKRDVAVGKGQLGTLLMLQEKYEEALKSHQEAQRVFEDLGDIRSAATAYHQIGRVLEEMGRYRSAEESYRKSLAIKVQIRNRSGEASSLGQLGILSNKQGKWEESNAFLRQSAGIYSEQRDLANEGKCRNNLASNLVILKSFGEARKEILKAIACKKGMGHAAQLWKSYEIIYDLEKASQNPIAAQKAKEQARELYLSYRKDGGIARSGSGRLADQIWAFIQADEAHKGVEPLLDLLNNSQTPEYLQFLIPKLQAILSGSRDPNLAADQNLNYADQAELLFLLERIHTLEKGK